MWGVQKKEGTKIKSTIIINYYYYNNNIQQQVNRFINQVKLHSGNNNNICFIISNILLFLI